MKDFLVRPIELTVNLLVIGLGFIVGVFITVLLFMVIL